MNYKFMEKNVIYDYEYNSGLIYDYDYYNNIIYEGLKKLPHPNDIDLNEICILIDIRDILKYEILYMNQHIDFIEVHFQKITIINHFNKEYNCYEMIYPVETWKFKYMEFK